MLVHAPCRVGQTINEKWPLSPAWPYPASKLRAEQLLIADHGRIWVMNQASATVTELTPQKSRPDSRH